LFTEEERVAFAFGEAMTATPAAVSDDLFTAAERLFSTPQLVELAATIAMENYRARFNCAFAIPSQGFYRPQMTETESG
jgi:alkylhydroperoxidase family enzyme